MVIPIPVSCCRSTASFINYTIYKTKSAYPDQNKEAAIKATSMGERSQLQTCTHRFLLAYDDSGQHSESVSDSPYLKRRGSSAFSLIVIQSITCLMKQLPITQ